jgi:prolyl oligopeptidase
MSGTAAARAHARTWIDPRTRITGVLCILMAVTALRTHAQQADPFMWLEDVESPRALEWVEARNAATVAELTQHPAYEPIFERTMQILDSDDRIPFPAILGDRLYNFWQDADNPRGVWRRTSWESYLTGEPEWEAVLDIDALAEAEDVPWAYGGTTCLPPDFRRCLVRLSRGGADAVEVREFDTGTRMFIGDGFTLRKRSRASRGSMRTRSSLRRTTVPARCRARAIRASRSCGRAARP